jgi:hypothetical protein
MSDAPPSGNVQQGASLQDVQVTGGDSSIFSIGNTIQHNYLRQETDFIERKNLDEFKSPYFPSPVKVEKLIKTIREQSLLIFGGSHTDRADLALHLAVKLIENIKLKSNQGESSESVWEWNGRSNPQSLFAAIRGEGVEEVKKNKNLTQIFVLLELQPQHSLEEIQKSAKTGANYVIATTNVPLNKWAITVEQKKLFWWEPSDEHPLYKPDDLAEALIQRLSKKSVNNELQLYLRAIVAEQLKTVASVGDCIQLLLAEKELSEEAVRQSVYSARQDRKISLEKWFRTLDYREQLLALGLSLFDGLFTDQFFAALEKVVRNVWQQRDSTLRALDYCDLENLGNYFEFFEITLYDSSSNGFKFVKTADYPTEIEISRIDIRRTDDRQLLFEVAWKTHRRQILTALLEIVQMVKESVENKPSNWELYGGSIRRRQLHSVISETFSDIGLVGTSTTSAVQDALLRLASDPEFEVKDVAAIAVARWYLYGRDKELFGTLRRFYSLAIQKERDDQKTQQWQDHIGATVALIISYAAANAPPDELSQEFLNWLKELSENPSPIVRAYFGYHTLFYLVPLHLRQLREMLKEWTQKFADLNEAIALSLASACTVRPIEVQKILQDWYDEGEKKLSSSPNASNITESERLLATVALTYGEIKCDRQ